MKTIVLTDDQRSKVIDALSDVRYDNGDFDIEIGLDEDLLICASGNVETEGYTEDDYFNGTGSYVETYRNTFVNLTAYIGVDSEECEVDETTMKEAVDCLNAA